MDRDQGRDHRDADLDQRHLRLLGDGEHDGDEQDEADLEEHREIRTLMR